MFNLFKSKAPDYPAEISVPERLDRGATLGFLSEGIEMARAVLLNAQSIRDVAEARGYWHVLTQQTSPTQLTESFVHEREEQRLILNSHSYPGHLRRMMSLHIPGGASVADFENVREHAGLLGETSLRSSIGYGDWLMPDAAAPVCIELNQDHFDGAPLMLRVAFHQVRVTD